MNIAQIAKMAQQMQSQVAQAQDELKETTLEATAGGGAVRVVITGAGEMRAIEIDPSAVDPAEVEMLQDLVLTAVNDAITRAKELINRQRTTLGSHERIGIFRIFGRNSGYSAWYAARGGVAA